MPADEERNRRARASADLAALEVQDLAVVFEPAAGGEAAQRCRPSRPCARRGRPTAGPSPRSLRATGLMPTPSRNRSSLSTAMLAACLATSTGGRIASFSTNVVKRMRSVFAARYGMSANGSMIGLSSRNARSPSAVYGILRIRLGGEDQAVGHDERVVARVFGRLRERREERRITEGFGVAESHAAHSAPRASSAATWRRRNGAAARSRSTIAAATKQHDRHDDDDDRAACATTTNRRARAWSAQCWPARSDRSRAAASRRRSRAA